MSKTTFPRGGCWFVVVRMEKEYALMSEKGGPLVGFKTLQEARDHFEIAYDRRHGSTYERSMSACIHYIFFAPKVVHIKTKRELVSFAAKPPQSVSWWTPAGGMDGVLLDKKKGAALYRKATLVRLMKSEQEYVERYGSTEAVPT